jgi:hypothetical protein
MHPHKTVFLFVYIPTYSYTFDHGNIQVVGFQRGINRLETVYDYMSTQIVLMTICFSISMETYLGFLRISHQPSQRLISQIHKFNQTSSHTDFSFSVRYVLGMCENEFFGWKKVKVRRWENFE